MGYVVPATNLEQMIAAAKSLSGFVSSDRHHGDAVMPNVLNGNAC
jgi:hypothetical protein